MVWFFLENIPLGLLTLFMAWKVFSAAQVIYYDEKSLLDNIDKLMIVISFFQLLLLTFFLLITSLNSIYLQLRILRLLQEIFLLIIFAYFIFDESQYEMINRIAFFLIGILICFWIFSFFKINSCEATMSNFIEENSLWLIISSINLVINLLSIVLAIRGLIVIYWFFQSEKKENYLDSEDEEKIGGEEDLTLIAVQEMRNRRNQIIYLVSTHCLSSVVLFGNDFYQYVLL